MTQERKTSTTNTPTAKATLLHHLQADFEHEPVEDGMEHEAEHTLKQALADNPDPGLPEWLHEFCTDASKPAFASSVLRCLSQLEHPNTPEWRAGLVRDALSIDDIEIRDAAIQAVEHWEESTLVDVLKAHQEPEKWLRDYLEGVISDLNK